MPGYPEAVKAEPEGAPAQSSEEAAEGEAAKGERGGEEGGESEDGGEEAPEQEEAEEAPPEESEEAPAKKASAEESGAEGIADFSAKRLALRLPPPVPKGSGLPTFINLPTVYRKKQTLGQVVPAQDASVFPVILLGAGVLAVGALVYYLKHRPSDK
jgi:hypothetical protein